MSPIAAMNVAATITLTPGTVISRLTSGQDSASAAISGSTSAISAVEELDLAHGRVDCLALGDRQLLLGKPAPALDAEQIRRRRAVLEAAHEHRVDLVLRARARSHELRPAREPAPHRADALVGRPDPVELPGPRAAWPARARRGGRSSPAPGGCRCRSARPRSRARLRGSMIRAISQALPVTSSATWSCASRLCANSSSASGFVSIRPAERSSPSSTIATSQKSRWTSSATALTSSLLAVVDSKQENRWANDIDGSALAAQPGKSQGRPLKSPGSSPSSKTACPACVLPEGPSSQSTEPKPTTGHHGAFRAQFHAPNLSSGRHVARTCWLPLPRMRASPPVRSSRPLGTRSKRLEAK